MDSTGKGSPEGKTRKILRGNLTTFQVLVATVLGAMLGFVPGFVNLEDLTGGFIQAPGLILSVLAVVLILRCSLVIFVITLVGAKFLAFPLAAASFSAGRILLDGPTGSLFETMINAPFLAWFGLEYYQTSGGLLLGLIVGVFWAVFLRKALRRTATEEELANRKWQMPVRLVGAVAVILITGGAWLLQSFLGSAAIKDALRGALEQGNGATVELAGLDLDLSGGTMTISGLAMADPNNLSEDLFRAAKLEMKLGTTALLRRRLEIESVTSNAAETGSRRSEPGKRIHPDQAPKPPEPKDGEKTLDDYFDEAKLWEERLAQANRWLETIFRTNEAESEEDRDKRIEAEIETRGRANVAALHLIKGAPLLLVKEVNLLNISIVSGGADDQMSIHASNLSTNPSLVESPAKISIKSKKNAFGLDLALDTAKGGVVGSLFHNAISVDAIAGQFKSGGKQVISGGTLSISLGGLLKSKGEGGYWIDFPLKVSLLNTTLSIKGMKPTRIDKLELPLGLRGPLSSPQIKLDDSALIDSLVTSGKAELANELKRQTDKLLGDKVPDDVKGVVKGVLDGKGEAAVKKAAEDAASKATKEAKKKAEAELKKKATDELKRVLPISVFDNKKKADAKQNR